MVDVQRRSEADMVRATVCRSSVHLIASIVLQVKCVVETRDVEHSKELENLLRTNYSHVIFGTNVA